MADNDQVELAGLCFPPPVHRVLWGSDNGGGWGGGGCKEVKGAEIPGRGAKRRQSSYLFLSNCPPPIFPPPELLSKPVPSTRSMTGLLE